MGNIVSGTAHEAARPLRGSFQISLKPTRSNRCIHERQSIRLPGVGEVPEEGSCKVAVPQCKAMNQTDGDMKKYLFAMQMQYLGPLCEGNIAIKLGLSKHEAQQVRIVRAEILKKIAIIFNNYYSETTLTYRVFQLGVCGVSAEWRRPSLSTLLIWLKRSRMC